MCDFVLQGTLLVASESYCMYVVPFAASGTMIAHCARRNFNVRRRGASHVASRHPGQQQQQQQRTTEPAAERRRRLSTGNDKQTTYVTTNGVWVDGVGEYVIRMFPVNLITQTQRRLAGRAMKMYSFRSPWNHLTDHFRYDERLRSIIYNISSDSLEILKIIISFCVNAFWTCYRHAFVCKIKNMITQHHSVNHSVNKAVRVNVIDVKIDDIASAILHVAGHQGLCCCLLMLLSLNNIANNNPASLIYQKGRRERTDS